MKGDEIDPSLVIGDAVVDLPNGNMMSIDDFVGELVRRKRRRKRKTTMNNKKTLFFSFF